MREIDRWRAITIKVVRSYERAFFPAVFNAVTRLILCVVIWVIWPADSALRFLIRISSASNLIQLGSSSRRSRGFLEKSRWVNFDSTTEVSCGQNENGEFAIFGIPTRCLKFIEIHF